MALPVPNVMSQLSAKHFLGLYVLALAVRLGAACVASNAFAGDLERLLPDEQQYWDMARSIRAGEGMRDELGFRATRMPLYPLFLAAVAGLGIKGAIIIQCALAASVAPLTTLLASRFAPVAAALLAGTLTAVDPYFVYFSGLLLTEAIYLPVFVALWFVGEVLARRLIAQDSTSSDPPSAALPGLAHGLLAGLAILIRESSALTLFAQGLYLAAAGRFRGRTMKTIALSGGIVLLTLLPWALRNHRVTGAWCWLTFRGGISLYDGFRPGADGSSDLGDVKASKEVQAFIERGDEAGWNRYFTQAAIKAIREDPARAVRLAFQKLARTWSPFPNAAEGQRWPILAVSAIWSIFVYGFFLTGLGPIIRNGVSARPTLTRAPRVTGGLEDTFKGGSAHQAVRNSEEGPGGFAFYLALPVVVVCLVHLFFVGSVRYRLPAMPMVEICAAAGIASLCGRGRERGRGHQGTNQGTNG